jgi:hypothetical protein
MGRRHVGHAIEFGDRLASATFSVGAPAEPLRTPAVVNEPESTMNRLEPMVLIVCCTAYCAPRPMAIMMTTAPTPITMPSMVSAVRRRLAPIASQASPSIGWIMRHLHHSARR